MRFEGQITQWNDDRGFGFISPTSGGDPLFVHISAFPLADRTPHGRPVVGDRVSFEVELDTKGRKQARRVHRPDAHPVRSATTAQRSAQVHWRNRRQPSSSSVLRRFFGLGVSVAVLVLIAWLAYPWWAAYGPFATKAKSEISTGIGASDADPQQLRAIAAPTTNFRCDGRQHCSQMTSCAEATFFLRNCPDTKMDGNRDGVPCEQQWCTSPWAK